MILNHKVVEELHQKWPHFIAFDDSSRGEAKSYKEAIDKLFETPLADLLLQLSKIENPGAIPTPEFDSAPNLCLSFPEQFSNHQEARSWACDVLLEHTTFAVDGSQIRHDPNFSIPVAAVQVAWFENHHKREGGYTKGVSFELLTPDQLAVEFNGDRIYSEQTVNTRRFELEIETLCNLMRQLAAEGREPARLPVALFDSSLAISFADRLQEETRKRHVEAVLKLLRCSRETEIPVVGYIDTSYARDLTNMLACCFRQHEPSRVHDAQLLNDRLNWGSRTPLFICARGSADRKRPSILESFGDLSREICFVYLKTNSSMLPARLEIPKWVYDRGLLNEVIDIVRAEVIVGNGYPYVIESADAAAVITARDREAFYAIFHRFASEQGAISWVSQKAASKYRRR